MPKLSHWYCLSLAILLLAGCGGSTEPLAEERLWTFTLTPAVDTDMVAGVHYASLGEVMVTDPDGEPVVGATVIVRFVANPGQYDDPFEGVTDSGGHFTIPAWTAGPKAGWYAIEAGTNMYPPQLHDTLTFRVIPGPPTRLMSIEWVPVMGLGWQIAWSFWVEDAYGNRIPDRPVDFTLVDGDGYIVPEAAATDTSGIIGIQYFAAGHADTVVVRGVAPQVPDSIFEVKIVVSASAGSRTSMLVGGTGEMDPRWERDLSGGGTTRFRLRAVPGPTWR